MKIVIENKIPFIAGIFESVANVVYLAPEEFTAKAVRDADAIIVRTRTRCDASLLSGSCCKIVATATIGTDHIDIPWCKSNGIIVANAPGCNAPAVAQYVYASAATLLGELSGRTIGVVGVGHVGRIVADWGEALGLRVLRCDPPRAEAEGDTSFTSLSQIAHEADIITLHTPLERGGKHPTFHLANQEFFDSLRRQPLFINAARGPVTDTSTLIRAIHSHTVGYTAIDCWEGEPAINRELLSLANIATPHIAGYSKQGKLRATQAAVKAVACALGLHNVDFGKECAVAPTSEISLPAISASYDPRTDTQALRTSPDAFEMLRNSYNLRNEVGF